MRALVIAAAAATVLGLALTDRAAACSCAAIDPRERLPTADAAVIGTIVDDGRPATLRVDEAVKGDLPAEIELPHDGDGGNCGAMYTEGETVALFLERQPDGGWYASLCDSVEPDDMRRAARPLPEPAGSGTAVLLGVGSFGGRRLTAFGADGRLLAYGRGRGWSNVSVCPGSEHVVEHVGTTDRRRRLVTRRLRDMEVVRARPAPVAEGVRVACRSRDGERVALLLSDADEPVARGRVVELRRGSTRTLRRARIAGATFAGDTAYLSEGGWGRDLVALDLRTGRARSVARVPKIPGEWRVSPDGRRLATIAFGDELTEPSVTVAVDLRSGAVHTRDGGGSVAWLGPDRLLHNGEGLHLYDGELNPVRRGDAGPDGEIVRAGDRVYATGGGRLLEVDTETLRTTALAPLPSEEIRELVPVPGGVTIRTDDGGAGSTSAAERRTLRLATGWRRYLW